MVAARTAAETERVRNTLLASISHDFRTPLASILGSATSLLDYGDKLDAATKKDLLGQIKHEAESLDEMVRNLLAMTRIDAGALELRRDWIDLREIVERVVSATRRRGAAQAFEVALPLDLPLVHADATLVEQAIGNIIGNSVSHTPKETHVNVDAVVTSENVALRVTDDGPGHSLRTFCRTSSRSSFACATLKRRAPTAAKAPASASPSPRASWKRMAASIAAESPVASGRGTRITLTFPREEAPA